MEEYHQWIYEASTKEKDTKERATVENNATDKDTKEKEEKDMAKESSKGKTTNGKGQMMYSGKGWQQQQQQGYRGKGKSKNKSKTTVNIYYRCYYPNSCKATPQRNSRFHRIPQQPGRQTMDKNMTATGGIEIRHYNRHDS